MVRVKVWAAELNVQQTHVVHMPAKYRKHVRGEPGLWGFEFVFAWGQDSLHFQTFLSFKWCGLHVAASPATIMHPSAVHRAPARAQGRMPKPELGTGGLRHFIYLVSYACTKGAAENKEGRGLTNPRTTSQPFAQNTEHVTFIQI